MRVYKNNICKDKYKSPYIKNFYRKHILLSIKLLILLCFYKKAK